MAFTRAKVHWGKMDAEKLMTEGPPEGKEHRKPELYYDGVLKGPRLVEEQCHAQYATLSKRNSKVPPRILYFHEYNHVVLCNVEQGHFYYLLLCGYFIY